MLVTPFEEPEQLPGDRARSATPELAGTVALRHPWGGMGAGRSIIAKPGQDDRGQGPVELAVAPAVP